MFGQKLKVTEKMLVKYKVRRANKEPKVFKVSKEFKVRRVKMDIPLLSLFRMVSGILMV